MITSAKEKAEYDGNPIKFPVESNRMWYKSLLSEKNQDEYVVFSNDGLAFYTSDGGETFKKLLITSDTHAILMNIPTVPYGDKEEFGEFSDTYKITKDLGQRWMAAENQEERDRLHELAEKARKLAREGTPLKYGQDVIMETLHANAVFAQALRQVLNTSGIINPELTAYSCFVGMTFTAWNYKYNPDWQVPYPIFNGKDMSVNNNKNWTPWIYFDGDIISADKFGNINLGYVGTKMGYHGRQLKNLYTMDKDDGSYVIYGIDMANQDR